MNERYWDTVNKTEKLFKEVPDPLPEGIVALPAGHDAWKIPPAGKRVGYDVNGIPIHQDKPTLDDLTFEQKKERKCKSACQLYVNAMNNPAALGPYTQREIDTFHEQARESIAYEKVVTDGGTPDAADYPMLKAIADQHTDRTLDDQVTRVLSKRTAFNTYCGAVTGKHQAIKDAIDACTTQAELDAIDETEITTFAEGLVGG